MVVWTANNGKIVKDKLIRYGKLNNKELLKNMLGVERDSFPPLHFNCAIIKRDVFKNIRFTTTQNAYVDLECWYRILTSDTKFIYVPVVGMYYRRHQNYISSNRARMRKSYLKCIENIYKLNRDDLM